MSEKSLSQQHWQTHRCQDPLCQIILAWTLESGTIIAFLAAGAGKLAGSEDMVVLFNQIGWGQGLRYLTGSLEIFGTVLILWPHTAFIGSSLLASIMMGSVLIHLFLIGDSPFPAMLLMTITLLIAYLRYPQLSALISEPRT
ncbi:hypothetical protein N836_01375 [Leptolyngbya sp. Heron Island J]|nr:hypothetical protein N836_01375 [Leptolyngbya sp. Heron Island J]